MSMLSRVAAEAPRSGLTSEGLFAVALRKIAQWPRALMKRLYRRAAIKSLSELDDRALSDIGLSRCHIEDAVRGEVRLRGYSS